MGTPTCVNRIVLNDSEHVMFGDSVGMVNMILAETSEPFKSRDLLYTEHTQDYVCLHDKHDDWVTKVRLRSMNRNAICAAAVRYALETLSAVAAAFYPENLSSQRCSTRVMLPSWVAGMCRSGWGLPC
jgi:hypothetical protein